MEVRFSCTTESCGLNPRTVTARLWTLRRIDQVRSRRAPPPRTKGAQSALVTGPAQRARPADGEAPGEQRRRARPHPAVRMAQALACPSSGLPQPAGPVSRRSGRHRRPADPRREVHDRPVKPVAPRIAAVVPGGVEARREPPVEPAPPLEAQAEVAKVRLVGEPAQAHARQQARLGRSSKSASAGRNARPRTSGRTRPTGIRGARCRRPCAAASAGPADTGIRRRPRPRCRCRRSAVCRRCCR